MKYHQIFDESITSQTNLFNGFWARQILTVEDCAELVANNVTHVYLEAGRFDGSNNNAVLLYTADWDPINPSILATSITNAKNAGLHVFAWVISQWRDTNCIDISTQSKRANAISNLVAHANSFGFDGIADDVEDYTTLDTYSHLVEYYNEAALASNNAGYQYFVAVPPWWLSGMGQSMTASITVDRIQIMLYDLPEPVEENFKNAMTFTLTYSTSPIGLGLHTYSYGTDITLEDDIEWVNEQLPYCSQDNFAGFDVFCAQYTSSYLWNSWSEWKAKDYSIPIS